MKKKIEIFQIDAFTDKPFKGNPAAVCFAEVLNSKEKQLIAREMNLSETAFISKSKIADYKLQWFTPTTEVRLCGHATVASLHFLAQQKLLKEGQQIKFETLSGILNCFREKNNYYMQLPIPKISVYKNSSEELLKVLRLKTNSAKKDLPIVIVNHETCYINVNSLKILRNITPDFNVLLKLSKLKKEFRNVVVYTLETFEKNNSAHSRCFAPYWGINEDPVTGSTNGPLLLVLTKLGLINQYNKIVKVTFEQGDFVGRKGRIQVILNALKNELYISGKAVTILKGFLSL